MGLTQTPWLAGFADGEGCFTIPSVNAGVGFAPRGKELATLDVALRTGRGYEVEVAAPESPQLRLVEEVA